MNKQLVLSIGLLVLLSGCSGIPGHAPTPDTTPDTTPTTPNTNTTNGLQVNYLNSYSESKYSYTSNTTEIDNITIGTEGNAQDMAASQSYAIVNTDNDTTYNIKVNISHGNSIITQKTYSLQPNQQINIKVYPPNGKFTDIAYRTTVTVANQKTTTSKVRIISPETSFWCNTKHIELAITESGHVGHQQLQTLMACSQTPATK